MNKDFEKVSIGKNLKLIIFKTDYFYYFITESADNIAKLNFRPSIFYTD